MFVFILFSCCSRQMIQYMLEKPTSPHTDLIGPCWDYVVTLFSSHTCYSLACLFSKQYFCPHDLRLIWKGTCIRRLSREDESQQPIRQAEGPRRRLKTDIINAYILCVNRTLALLLMYSSSNLYSALYTESRCTAPIS